MFYAIVCVLLKEMPKGKGGGGAKGGKADAGESASGGKQAKGGTAVKVDLYYGM